MALSKCCCCVDLLKGVKIIGIVGIVLSIVGIIWSITYTVSTGSNTSYSIIGFVPNIAFDVLLILATKKRKRNLMEPWLLLNILSMIGLLALIGISIWLGVKASKQTMDAAVPAWIYYLVVPIFTGFALVIDAYIWAVVFSLYKLLGQEGNRYQTNAEKIILA